MQVCKARWNGVLVAAKFLLSRDDAQRHTFMKEVVLLETLRHPNVINYLGHGEDAEGEVCHCVFVTHPFRHVIIMS